jgi:hypothetical protein
MYLDPDLDSYAGSKDPVPEEWQKRHLHLWYQRRFFKNTITVQNPIATYVFFYFKAVKTSA